MRVDNLAITAALVCALSAVVAAAVDDSLFPRNLATVVPEVNNICPTTADEAATCIIDLAQPYEPLGFQTDEAMELIAMAESDENVHSFIALECGKVVAEYYDDPSTVDDVLHLFSITKSWSALLFGVMEKEVSIRYLSTSH